MIKVHSAHMNPIRSPLPWVFVACLARDADMNIRIFLPIGLRQMMMERLTLVSSRYHIKNTSRSPESNLCSTFPRMKIGKITMFQDKIHTHMLGVGLLEQFAQFYMQCTVRSSQCNVIGKWWLLPNLDNEAKASLGTRTKPRLTSSHRARLP